MHGTLIQHHSWSIISVSFLKGLVYRRQQFDPNIIAIHDIGAHPDHTWCKKADVGRPEEYDVDWLKNIHMLPTIVPNARIMRYGYESQ